MNADLLQRRLQANPAFELVIGDALDEPERRALSVDSERLCGVLRPRVLGLATKAVDADVARLVAVLAEPALLPEALRRSLGARAEATVARLVLDEILAIESERGFVTGSAARACLFAGGPGDAADSPATCSNRIGVISREALEYAGRIVLPATDALWMRLYFYGRIPYSARWASRFPHAAEVETILAGKRGSATRKLLESCFVPVAPDPRNDRWRLYDHRSPLAQIDRDLPQYKLYVSPHPSAIVEAFGAVVTAVAEIGAPRFKVGSDAYGLLRSDKLIVYCTGRPMLDALAERVAPLLRGVPAHGVPFTAALSADGLLSYGIDPPSNAPIDGWADASERSWRMWIVRWLARTIERQRRDDPGHAEPWRYALDRLRFAGVDPRTWTPDESLFAGALG